LPSKEDRRLMKEEYTFELPVSMIDVVFLLLIFFMCATKFKQVEKRLDGNLPKDEGQMAAKPKEIEKPDEIRVKLWPREADKTKCWIAVNDRENKVNDFDQLYVRLRQLKDSMAGTPVIIDARREVHYQYVISAMDACKRAKIKDVKFQAPAVPEGGGDDWWHK
jgi:biopolymer transport protein ExbD